MEIKREMKTDGIITDTITFRHDSLRDDYEKQAKEQGYTFGKYPEIFEELGNALTMGYAYDMLTEEDYKRALKRLEKEMIGNLKKINQKEKNHDDKGDTR